MRRSPLPPDRRPRADVAAGPRRGGRSGAGRSALSAVGWAAAAAAVIAASGSRPLAAEDRRRDSSSVAATNGVVVHDVDAKLLAARVRDIDARIAGGPIETAARELADLASADLTELLEEGEGTYLSALESVLQRVAALPPAGLAAYRKILDPRARAALEAALAHGDAARLQRDAFRLAMTTDGPRLLVTLADLRLARGDAGGAARALEDLLRLWPADTADLSGVPRAAVVSRLSTALAAQGDAPGVRALLADASPALREAPSPSLAGRTFAQELQRAAAAAETAAAAATGPTRPAKIRAEAVFTAPQRERGAPAARDPDRIRERPLPIGTADAPAILARIVSSSRTTARVAALAPAPPALAADGTAAPAGTDLRPLWVWPSSAVDEDRPPGDLPFAPVRITDDLVAFTWPAPAAEIAERGGRFADAGEARHGLVVLSLAGEGRLVDERGRFEAARPDPAPLLEQVSFCGRPAVSGSTLFTTMVRHADDGSATELHVARFDLVPAGRDPQLRLRWHRHVLDASGIPPALHPAHQASELMLPVVVPSSPLLRNGRLFVASNTGAIVCLDPATGRPEWIETYARYGPSQRTVVREAAPESWSDVPLSADGAYLYAAPRDSEHLIQCRRAPTRARSLRIASFGLAGADRLLPDLIPREIAGVRDGVVFLSGRVARRSLGSVRVEGSPLAAFSPGARWAALAQVQEFASAGTPCLVSDAVLFPTAKALYRVPTAAFEGPPTVLWTSPMAADTLRGPDRLGVLVPDGARVWSVTPSRVVLFE